MGHEAATVPSEREAQASRVEAADDVVERGVGVEDPRISPINGSMVGMPPMMILTGTFDLLHVDAWRLRDKALRENVPLIYRSYEKMFHVWMAAPVPEARQALDEVADFIKHPHGVCLNTLTQLL